MNVHMTGHWVVYKVMQCLERLCKIIKGLENIYYKKLRCEHLHKNFEESTVRELTPYGLKIYKKRGISGISPNFLEQWN